MTDCYLEYGKFSINIGFEYTWSNTVASGGMYLKEVLSHINNEPTGIDNNIKFILDE